ncbi:HlyD family secretion protein [Methylobacterium sp. yr668]|uniref:HlyD family secretion protein n=1 Tax=Methylobacterium sp. yr668 TaxID=1761801 RepID=UPI000B110B66|nr:HlyD family secretion protein [Methylobacterium sp. yr668]
MAFLKNDPYAVDERTARPPSSTKTSPPVSVLPSAFNLFAVMTVVGGSILLAWLAWRYYFDTPWTRDGSVRVYTAQVASEVSGMVTAVSVTDNQAVQKGEVLFRIDDRDYRIAVQRAQAALERAHAQLTNMRAEADRRNQLSDLAVSAEVRQSYESNAQAAQGAYDATVADLANAKLNLERTEVRSPVTGYVTNLLLQTGTYANIGQSVMTLIDSESFWVTGYFEETQLRRIQVSDPTDIWLMGYPDRPIEGRVESLGRGIMDPNSAPGVAGLPSVNPVFTWVRLAQRIPVRIQFKQLPNDVHLAAGMTATIHVRGRSGAARR